ncbi:MAG: hypothetical protein V1873_04800 [Verrucomicrobiota bacterium]
MKKYTDRIFVAVALVAMAIAPAAFAATNEVMYLADTMADQDGFSSIYRVRLEGGVANLELIPNGLLPYNHCDVIAAEPDGSKLWVIDDYFGLGTDDTGKLLWYNVIDATLHEVAVVTYNGIRMVQIDQAAMAPDGTLYIANNLSDSIYTLDKATAVATLVGKVMTPAGVAVDVAGSDIAFGAEGSFYLWINIGKSGAPQGLYQLQLPAQSGIVYATWLGGTTDVARRFTGLALRANGLGDLVGSITKGALENTIAVVDKATGLFVGIYPMMKNGVAFDHTWGDMSVGPLARNPDSFCTYTIGYWKNHAWNGAVVSILDVYVDETLGKEILGNAKAKNMSMLFAQLIAAKLNVNNASGIAIIDGAEDFLAMLDDATGDIVVYDAAGVPHLNWNRAFDSDTVKQMTGYWAGLLDEFNNIYHCADDVSVSANTTSAGGGKKK